MADARRFQKGSGVYRCEACGKATRATGRGDNETVSLCAACYDEISKDSAEADGFAEPPHAKEEC